MFIVLQYRILYIIPTCLLHHYNTFIKTLCFFFRHSTEFSNTNSSQNHEIGTKHEGTTIKYNDTQTNNISKYV